MTQEKSQSKPTSGTSTGKPTSIKPGGRTNNSVEGRKVSPPPKRK